MMLCFVIGVSVLLNPVYSSEVDSHNEPVASCSEKIPINGNGQGFLKFEEKCPIFNITLYSSKETSILRLLFSIHYLGNISTTEQNESTDDTDNTTVKLNIYEPTNGKEQYIQLSEWQWLNANKTDTRTYLTRTSSVRMSTSFSGNGANYNLSFAYEEIDFKMCQYNSSTPGLVKDEYQLNTVSLYRMQEEPKTNWSSISITLNRLDVDTEMGEYILIGAGTEPFEDSTPLFISQPKADSTFYVDSTSAYVVFVSTSSERENMRDDIIIHWEHTGTEITGEDPVTEDPLSLLHSAPICFNNVSLALTEFSKSDEDEIFKDFRKHFAEMAKNYLSKFRNNENFKNLGESSVKLYRITNKLNTPPLYAMIRVKSEGRSFITQRQLKDIIHDFKKEDDKKEFNYQIVECTSNVSISWAPLIYGLVPVFGFFFLMIWAWRQKVFDQTCCSQKGGGMAGRGLESSPMSAEPNLYEGTTPKVVQINEDGRRETLIPHSSNQIIGEDEINMIDMSQIPSTSRGLGSARFPASYSSRRRRTSLQSLLLRNENIPKKSHADRIEDNEKEHLYDSVNCDNTNETKL